MSGLSNLIKSWIVVLVLIFGMKSRLLSYFLFELNFLLVFLLIHVGLHLDVTFLDAILIIPLTNTWTAKLFID